MGYLRDLTAGALFFVRLGYINAPLASAFRVNYLVARGRKSHRDHYCVCLLDYRATNTSTAEETEVVASCIICLQSLDNDGMSVPLLLGLVTNVIINVTICC